MQPIVVQDFGRELTEFWQENLKEIYYLENRGVLKWIFKK
jgi:hypothetical protein